MILRSVLKIIRKKSFSKETGAKAKEFKTRSLDMPLTCISQIKIPSCTYFYKLEIHI